MRRPNAPSGPALRSATEWGSVAASPFTQVSARAMSSPRAENWTLASSVTVRLFLAEHITRPPGVVLWGVIEPSWAWANRRCAFRAASNALEPPAPDHSKEHGRPRARAAERHSEACRDRTTRRQRPEFTSHLA